VSDCESYIQVVRAVLTVNRYPRFPRQVIPKLFCRYLVPIHSQLCNFCLPPFFLRRFHVKGSIIVMAFPVVSEYETQK